MIKLPTKHAARVLLTEVLHNMAEDSVFSSTNVSVHGSVSFELEIGVESTRLLNLGHLEPGPEHTEPNADDGSCCGTVLTGPLTWLTRSKAEKLPDGESD